MNNNHQWTDESVEHIIAQWKSGKSGGVIAKELGLTRNAVLGKIFRVLIRRGEHSAAHRKKYIRPPRIGSAAPSTPDVQAKPVRTPKVSLPRIEKRTVPQAIPVPIFTLTEAGQPCGIADVTGCRWPVGYDESVPGRHLFCNREQQEFSPYCAAHRPKPGTLSAEFSGEELNLIRAHWNKGQGLEWLAIKMKRAKNVVSRQAGRMGLGRTA